MESCLSHLELFVKKEVQEQSVRRKLYVEERNKETKISRLHRLLIIHLLHLFQLCDTCCERTFSPYLAIIIDDTDTFRALNGIFDLTLPAFFAASFSFSDTEQ